MVGLLTERDIVKKCCPDTQCTIKKARDIMSSPLVTIDADATIGEAANLMAEKRIRRLLVTEGGKSKGLLRKET